MTILIDNDYYSFEQSKVGAGTPVFILPPFAGRGGSVTDSLFNLCESLGKTTYRYELKSATSKTKDLSVSGLIEIIHTCHNKIMDIHGEVQIDLLGTCQGGWLAAIYTSLYPTSIHKLATFAAPINLKTGCNNAIEKYCETIDIEKHKLAVAMNGGIQSGLSQWIAFSLLAPEFVYYQRYADLMAATMRGDHKAVAKWWKMNSWYDSTRDLAGVWFLDVLENHFTKNKLYEGTWEVCGKLIDLSNITCPVLVMTGDDDIITSEDQALGLLKRVSSEVLLWIPLEGAGHTRVFTGKKELIMFADRFFEESV